MSAITAMTVFVLGMRHGADPDHFAAIDNVTRNSHTRSPRSSRLTGLFFGVGHSAMVLVLAVLFSTLSSRLLQQAHWLESAGAWLSVVILIAVAAINVRSLIRNDASISGIKTRLLPRVIRESSNPLIAVPIGLLFGLGFETSSQIAAYGAAFTQGGGAVAGAAVGVAFCAGLIVTDMLDGLLVHHVVSHRSSKLPVTARLWLWCVTIFAVAIAGYELVGLAGVSFSARTDLFVGLGMVGVLVCIFTGVIIASRRHLSRCKLADDLESVRVFDETSRLVKRTGD